MVTPTIEEDIRQQVLKAKDHVEATPTLVQSLTGHGTICHSQSHQTGGH